MRNDDTLMRRHLEALPEPPLPDALWARVARARRQQLARRRLVLGGGIAIALAFLVLPFRLPVPGDRAMTDDIASADAVSPRAPATSDPGARLRILDRELQAAYRRGSDDAGIAELWHARNALLRESGRATPVRPVRI